MKRECLASLGRVELSGAETDRREAQCSRCGRWLKIRPTRGSPGEWPTAILPRHNEPKP